MADFDNNYYNDNLIIHISPNQIAKFEKIKNIEDLPHKFITQPKSNEFSIFISDNSDTYIGLCVSLVFGSPAIGLIIYIIFASHYNKDAVYNGIIISFLFFLFSLFFTILDLVTNFKRVRIILDVDGLKIIKIYKCLCRQSKYIFEKEIKSIEMSYDKRKKSFININYYDNNNEKHLLVRRSFDEDEAGYLVYILNNYLQGKSSSFSFTPYNNY